MTRQTVSPDHDPTSEMPAHTPGTTRGEDIGAEFQRKNPGDVRSDAAGGSRVKGVAGSTRD